MRSMTAADSHSHLLTCATAGLGSHSHESTTGLGVDVGKDPAEDGSAWIRSQVAPSDPSIEWSRPSPVINHPVLSPSSRKRLALPHIQLPTDRMTASF